MPEIIAKKNKGGRPDKLTKEIHDRIVLYVTGGNYLETAAKACGINRVTLLRWLELGAKQKKGKYKEFCSAVDKALGNSEARDVAALDKAINGWEVVKKKAVTRLNKTTGKQDIIEQSVESHTEFMPMVALERLRRRFPQRWGGRDSVEIVGNADSPVVVESLDDAYSGKKMVEWLVALADVKLIPPEILNAIDVTPVNGTSRINGIENT